MLSNETLRGSSPEDFSSYPVEMQLQLPTQIESDEQDRNYDELPISTQQSPFLPASADDRQESGSEN